MIFFEREGLPERSDVLGALADLDGKYEWQSEHETAVTYALGARLGDSDIAVSIVGAPLEPELYREMLDQSGLADEDRSRIADHGSHARVVYMDEETPVEPVERMVLVYRVVSRLGQLGSVGVLAPASGVFVVGLEPADIEARVDEEVPPLDLWVAIEKRSDDLAATAGASYLGLPEVELEGVGILDPEATYETMLNVLLYLRRIRRELVAGETLHVGLQPWTWLTMRSQDDVVHLRRVDPDSREVIN